MRSLLSMSWLLWTAFGLIAAPPAGSAEPDFQGQIAPLLARRCLSCHAGSDPAGKLDLTRLSTARTGGESGPALSVEHPLESALWQRIVAGEMPPQSPLPSAEQELIRQWLESGARWDDFVIDPLRYSSEERAGYDWWSLQPLVRPPLPDGPNARNPIDAFVVEQWQAHGLSANPKADRRVLLRRLSFDLIGLPPTQDEMATFLADQTPNAYERQVERLLASPRYGERWARHWLDVVRFGESNGFERDLPRPHAWPYRDWVIQALNDDLPYDDFVRWQLAADSLQPDDPAAAAALGFLVAGPHDTVIPVSVRMRQTMRQDEMEDLIAVVGQTFLGLTINCARCHDHKFDPISSREYYQLVAAFSGVDHVERTLTATPAASRFALTMPEKIYTAGLAQPTPTKVLRRGNVDDPGDDVVPAGLELLPGHVGDLGLRSDALEHHRRERLAHWITDRRNGLFARVMVNRVWHYHFGTGLVATPNDFGFHGGRPSHPELLDWLACEFIDGGYSLKHLHRLMVTSAAYRQSSAAQSAALRVDADNRWLWRMTPRRLDAEQLRDALLVVTDTLNPQLGGPSYQDFHSHFFKGTQFYEPIDAQAYDAHRRTIYRMWARSGRNPLLDTFDCPDPSTSTPKRSSTVTPLQALSLLNNPFTRRMADALAHRIQREAGDDLDRQIDQGYAHVFQRRPDDRERQLLRDFIPRHGLAAACLAWFNASEFVYLD